MYETVANVAWQCWLVLGQMAPYLLFGFLMAGLLSVCVSPQWVERQLGHPGFGPVLKAALFGVPLPLCSCGVIPVSASIRRHGASRAATTSFLLSTPQTGVDSIAVTYALLGPVFAVFRPIAALLTGLLGGGLVQLFGEPEQSAAPNPSKPPACKESCCTERHRPKIIFRALRYGLVTLPRDIGIALLVGVVIAGAISAAVEPGQLKPYVGGGVVAILMMMAVGIPIYVCATASVPIAAGLIHMGASPGAALAFLIAGPATNAATITTVWKFLGRRTAVLYLLTIAFSAVGFGLLLDWLFAAVQVPPPHLGAHDHGAGAAGWPSHLWAVGILAVLAYSYLSPAPRDTGAVEIAGGDAGGGDAAGKGSEPAAAPVRQRIELAITGMTCSHCAAGATRALTECPGVDSAEVTLRPGRAVVRGEHLDSQQLVGALATLGYTASVLN